MCRLVVFFQADKDIFDLRMNIDSIYAPFNHLYKMIGLFCKIDVKNWNLLKLGSEFSLISKNLIENLRVPSDAG